MTVDVKAQLNALRQIEHELRKWQSDPPLCFVDSAQRYEWVERLTEIRLALLSAEDAPPADPGTLTVTYGARSCTVSHVSRATYDAVCTVLHGREIQDPRPPGETEQSR